MVGFCRDHRRFVRLVLAAFGAGSLAVAVLLVFPWFRVFFTPPALRRTAIGFLIALEIMYGVVLVTVLFSTPVFGSVVYLSRRNGLSRPTAARGLMLCICCLCGLGLSEAIAAVRLASIHRAPPLSKGDPELSDRFDDPTSSDELTLVVLGESSAVGIPYESWLSAGKIVAWQLGQAMPGRRFRVEMLAKPGDTMEGQYQKLAGLRRRPDALIVYCGHNEFAADLAWSRRVDHYGESDCWLLSELDELARRVSPLSRLIRETIDKYRVAIAPPDDARPPLVDVPAYTPAEFTSRLEGFRRRLEAITAYGERIGALPILVVPPSNDAGFDPSRSFLPAMTPGTEREAFARDFLAAHESEDSEPATAIKLYAIGPHGLLDDHLFQDGMHPSLRGQIALAQAILEALHARRAFGWSGGAPMAVIDPARCAAHFGLRPKDWNPLCERGYMFYFATARLRHDRRQRFAKATSFANAARRIGAGEPAEAVGLPNIGAPAIEQARPGIGERRR